MIWLTLLILGFIGYLGWRFSNAILKPEPYGLYAEFKILAYQDGQVSLSKPKTDRQFANTMAQGQYALLWSDSVGRLGPIIAETDTSVTRKLELVLGEPPKAGEAARLDSFIFRQNPKADHGIDFQEHFLDGPVGKLQCWWIPQDPEKAIFLLHGRRRGQIIEVQRILPKLVTMGYSVLALSYRNHSQSTASPDGFYHYGASEWQDARVGLDFLEQQGIKEFALYGFSMGGAVSLELLKRLSPEGLPKPTCLILDAPLLDPKEVFTLGAHRLGIPLLLASLLSSWAMLISQWRSGIDWKNLDQRIYASQLALPVLLFMGTADTTIPIKLVDEFAARVQDIDYHRLEAVEHVEAWNIDPFTYETKLEAFLKSHLPRRSA